MRIRYFRQPALALAAAVLFPLLGYSDARGMSHCAYHAGTHSAADGVEASLADSENSTTEGNHGHHDGAHAAGEIDDPDHSHCLGGGPAAADGPSVNTCDCGLLCVGMSGPPPTHSGTVRTSYDGIAFNTHSSPVGSEEGLEPIRRIPYMLPFSNGPPAFSA